MLTFFSSNFAKDMSQEGHNRITVQLKVERVLVL